MSLSHSFSVHHAELYGVDCAILINHFLFWIEQNRAMGRNFHEGRTWMYQTQKEISAIYPYWNRDKVQDLLQKLVDFDVLIKGNFNKKKFDKTTWFAFTYESAFLTNRKTENTSTVTFRLCAKPHNGECENAQPIPDTNPNTNPKEQTNTPESDSPKEVVCSLNQQKKEEHQEKLKLLESYSLKESSIDRITKHELAAIRDALAAFEIWKCKITEKGETITSVDACICYAVDSKWTPNVTKEDIFKATEDSMGQKLVQASINKIKAQKILQEKGVTFEKGHSIVLGDSCVYIKTPRGTSPLDYTDENFTSILEAYILRRKI